MPGDPKAQIDLDELQQLVDDVQNLPLLENDTWYVVNDKWWQSLLTAMKDKKVNEVEEIDNSSIVICNKRGEYTLRDRLSEGVDFITLPESVYKRLRSIFGLDNEAKDFLPRKVVSRNGNNVVEVYPRIVNFILARDKNMRSKLILSSNDTMESIGERIITEMNLGNIEDLRFYIQNEDQMELVDLDQSVDTYFDTTQTVIIDQKVDDSWFVQKPSSESNGSKDNGNVERTASSGSQTSSSSSYMETDGDSPWLSSQVDRTAHSLPFTTIMIMRFLDARDKFVFYLRVWAWYTCLWVGQLFVPFRRRPIRRFFFDYPRPPIRRLENVYGGALTKSTPYTPGMCGLSNLGNTCFMSSALQCLSNIPALRDYFLSRKYEEDVNENNPLGTHGNLAHAFYDMIQNLWSGQNSCFNPRRIKSVIGQFAPRFSGFAQQDSHELMAYVLDGLHEDLNRIKKKPYIEDDDEWAKMPLNEYAKKVWEVYKMRNDSIIVDQFQGQIKSTLVCPVCAKISIKFDPFCLLSLPLPPRDSLKRQMITIILKSKKWLRFALTVNPQTTVSDAEELMRRDTAALGNTHLVFFSMQTNNTINDEITLLRSSDYVFQQFKEVFAVEVDHDPDAPNVKFVVVYNRAKISRSCSIPLVYSIDDESTFTSKWLQTVVLSSTIDNFFNKKDALNSVEQQPEDAEKEPYRLFYAGKNVQQVAITLNSDDKLDFPQGHDNYVTYQQISFVWRDSSKLFNGYKGAGLIERELSTNVRKKVDLIETIDWFTTKEQLGEEDLWYCPKCKKHERATKKLDLWSLPDNLVIHLKRFHYTRWTREKITWDVTIPVKGFDLSGKIANKEHGPAIYDLIAVSIHKGGLSSGHYVANAINDKNKQWVNFNDSYAGFITTPRDPYVSAEPYLLVYKRRKEGEETDDEEMMSVHQDANLDVEMEED